MVKQYIKNVIFSMYDTVFHAKVSVLIRHVKRTLSAQRSTTIHHSGVTEILYAALFCALAFAPYTQLLFLCPPHDVTLIKLQ